VFTYIEGMVFLKRDIFLLFTVWRIERFAIGRKPSSEK
jgi:hypothetical protein